MDVNTLSVIIALTGCFVGLAGWLSGRDKRVTSDAEWRGTINAKLDVIVGINNKVDSMAVVVNQHSVDIAAVAQSCKQAHYRIDEIKQNKLEEHA